jgi:hypothetical protein
MLWHRLGKIAIASMLVFFDATFAYSQQPPPGVQVGMLSCNLAPSIGLIVAESQRMSCRFAPNSAYPPIVALAGEYVGASGDIAVGVGAGANVLFGGSNRTIALQPLSVQGQAGLNVSLGVSGLTLALAP